MQFFNIQFTRLLSILLLTCGLLLSACGGSDNSGNTANTSGATQETENEEEERESVTSTGCGLDDGGSAPLSFEIREVKGETSYSTPGIRTDNCLRVRFQVSSTGNIYFNEADLRVDISVNGATRIPLYTTDSECPDNGCEFGRPSDGYSDIIDFSLHARNGTSPKVKVDNAHYDWYCRVFVLPYPSCYRKILKASKHHWSGNLLIQTNESSNKLFENP